MPTPQIRKKRCKTWRCPNLHTNASGYCDACQAKWKAKHPELLKPKECNPDAAKEKYRRYDANRPSANARGYDARWTKFARDFLKAHPTCAICGQPARVCDHKTIPADVMVDAFGGFVYDEAQYQPLCYRCNTRKGLTDDERARLEYQDMKFRLETGKQEDE